jgi:dTDP-4-amino-4,6-dideoxygalactose transaminase
MTNQIGLADLQAVHAELDNELKEAVLRVVRSGRYVGGHEVIAFEEAFAEYLGAHHVVAVANGTEALSLALAAVGMPAGGEVLVPANTFIATAEAVVAAGATPRFVDVEADSGLIDLSSACERLTQRTQAIIPVHLYGRMVEMDAVVKFAQKHDLAVVEDAAQAHGARRDGHHAGTCGHAGCFSFFPGKNLGALGDAGAVVANDDGVAERLRMLRDHGRRTRDEHELVGRNSRMDALQAAALAVKLPHLDRWLQARREVAGRYRATLGPMLDWQPDLAEAESHHIFPILVEDRDQLQARLRERGITTGVHYRYSLPNTRAFASADPCPTAAKRAEMQLSLPIHSCLSDEDVTRIVDEVLACGARATADV